MMMFIVLGLSVDGWLFWEEQWLGVAMFEERAKRILRKSLMAISDIVVVNYLDLERERCAKLSSTLVSHFF